MIPANKISDAEQLFVRVFAYCHPTRWSRRKVNLKAVLAGEPIDSKNHELLADVKAVTYHRFEVRKDGGLWKATAVLDV